MIQRTSEEAIEQKDLAGRIEVFYRLLNAQDWQGCFELLDPTLRDTGKIKIDAYSNSLSSFFAKHGPLVNQSLEQLKVYFDAQGASDDRDFAYGIVVLEDREHHSLKIRERWVKASDGLWYTRMVGMV